MYKSILQTKQWAQLKEKYGQKAHWISDVLVFEHKLPFGKSFLYVPELGQAQLHDMEKIKLDELAKNEGVVFVRVEIVDHTDEKANYTDGALQGFIKSKDEIQPKHRRMINLRPTEDEILGQMKSKGRYNIKVSLRHGVEVKSFGPQDLHRGKAMEHEAQFWGHAENGPSQSSVSATLPHEKSEGVDAVQIFYDLYRQTVKREGITGRSIEYFRDLVDILGAHELAKVYIAYFGSKPLAAAIITFYDGIASYLYGGSSREHPEAMAPFAMHWQVMKDAKEVGLRYYDLLGIAPPNKPKHKWAGLSRFKENFGGKEVEIIGGYDKVYNQMWYRLFRLFRRNS